jgi:hypothetical protein
MRQHAQNDRGRQRWLSTGFRRRHCGSSCFLILQNVGSVEVERSVSTARLLGGGIEKAESEASVMENGMSNEVILAARLLIAALFLIFGWRKLMDYPGTVSRWSRTALTFRCWLLT